MEAGNHIRTSISVRRQYETRGENCFRKFMRCIQGNEHYKKMMKRRKSESGVNSVSMVDKISRVLFPLSFTAFMVTYAVAYTTWKFWLSASRSDLKWNLKLQTSFSSFTLTTDVLVTPLVMMFSGHVSFSQCDSHWKAILLSQWGHKFLLKTS